MCITNIYFELKACYDWHINISHFTHKTWQKQAQNIYLSCLCHRETWLVRLFLVLKTIPQKSQVSGSHGRWVLTCINMLSFLFPILPQTEHLYIFSEFSIISVTRLSGGTNKFPEGSNIKDNSNSISKGCHFTV